MLFDYDFIISVSNDKIEKHHQFDFDSYCQISLNMFDPDSFDSFLYMTCMIEWVLIEWRKQNIIKRFEKVDKYLRCIFETFQNDKQKTCLYEII